MEKTQKSIDGWEFVKSSHILDIRDGTHETPKYIDVKGIPLITSKNLKGNKIDFENIKYISEDDHLEISKRSKVEPGDILFAMIGTIGNPAIINGNSDFSIKNVGLFKKNESKILPLFLFYFLSSRTFEDQLYKRKLLKGTTQKFIPLGSLRNLEIPLPPLPEQQKIVAKLEELFSELDKGKEQLETALQQLKIYRQAVLKWAFEGKLTNKDVKVGELPEGWKWVSINEIVNKNKHSLKAGPFGSSLKKEFYVENGYKIYGQEQVINNNAYFGNYYVSEEKYHELNSNKIKPKDVLISLVGTVGKVLILPEDCEDGIINPRLIKVSLNLEIYQPEFFKYYFESSTVKSYYKSKAQGTTMDVLNLGIIKTIPFPLCPKDQQKEVMSEIERRLSVCDKLEETISQGLLQAESLRQSILKKAFEGKVA